MKLLVLQHKIKMSRESGLSIKNVTIFGGGQMGSGIAHVSFDLIYYSFKFDVH